LKQIWKHQIMKGDRILNTLRKSKQTQRY